ncbi:hypothetical protein AB1N83_012791 [Pleurotus pulmonarius]
MGPRSSPSASSTEQRAPRMKIHEQRGGQAILRAPRSFFCSGHRAALSFSTQVTAPRSTLCINQGADEISNQPWSVGISVDIDEVADRVFCGDGVYSFLKLFLTSPDHCAPAWYLPNPRGAHNPFLPVALHHKATSSSPFFDVSTTNAISVSILPRWIIVRCWANLTYRTATASVFIFLDDFGPAPLVRIRPLWCGVWTGYARRKHGLLTATRHLHTPEGFRSLLPSCPAGGANLLAQFISDATPAVSQDAG